MMNMWSGEIVARIDFDTRSLSLEKNLKGLSPRSRLIEKEPSLYRYTEAAKRSFGNATYEVILLVPREVDQYIIGTLSDVANKSGGDIKRFSYFRGIYVQRGNNLILGIFEGKLKNGPAKKLNVSIQLTS